MEVEKLVYENDLGERYAALRCGSWLAVRWWPEDVAFSVQHEPSGEGTNLRGPEAFVRAALLVLAEMFPWPGDKLPEDAQTAWPPARDAAIAAGLAAVPKVTARPFIARWVKQATVDAVIWAPDRKAATAAASRMGGGHIAQHLGDAIHEDWWEVDGVYEDAKTTEPGYRHLLAISGGVTTAEFALHLFDQASDNDCDGEDEAADA